MDARNTEVWVRLVQSCFLENKADFVRVSNSAFAHKQGWTLMLNKSWSLTVSTYRHLHYKAGLSAHGRLTDYTQDARTHTALFGGIHSHSCGKKISDLLHLHRFTERKKLKWSKWWSTWIFRFYVSAVWSLLLMNSFSAFVCFEMSMTLQHCGEKKTQTSAII